MTEETGSVYTLFRESDGVPVAAITALTPETADAQLQDGTVMVPGLHLGPMRLVNGQVVPWDRDLVELKQGLELRVRSKAGEGTLRTPYGVVSLGQDAILLLLLAAATGKKQRILFTNGTSKELTKSQIQDVVDEVFFHILTYQQTMLKDLATLDAATSREMLLDLIDIYWPDEGAG